MALRPYKRRTFPQTDEVPKRYLDGEFIDIERSIRTFMEALSTGVALPSYTVATVPDATINEARMIYVSDETGGAIPAFSDGTDWRRVTDRAVVS